MKDKLREAIIKAVPEIIELKFGCKIENGYASEDNPTRIGYFVEHIFRTARVNPGSHIRLTDGKRKFWEVKKDNDKLEIIGRPITLADVLRAIEKLNDVHSTIMSYKKTSKMKKVSVIIDILRLWNLKEPLSGQSEETIQFLKDILL